MTVLQGSVYPAQLLSDDDLTGATVTCTVTAPDGTNPTVSVDRTGTYPLAPVPALQIGTYLLVWTITGAVVGAAQDQFTVVAPQIDLLSLPELKDELALDPDDTEKDPKLRGWLKAATGVIENVTGPILPRTVTEVFDGGATTVILSSRWVASITSVTEYDSTSTTTLSEQTYGVPGTAAGYSWDRVTNILTRRDATGYRTFFRGGLGAVQVIYRAGLVTIPEDIQTATAELIRHWYRKNDTAVVSGYYGPTQGDGAVMVGNYMVPNAVMELLEPWRRPPGMA